ncbi:uncharacterized protein LOC116767464 isoform X2 [Danaus plexippus]|uniref:uncharacterized protein LOC116767464 isoform X2 n=1 Tax=Danaus plexippus TaxID=13037 RepID=UPI0013C50B6A|nr:uncharacterized protein LOC116767464 isoform X2 [Danaus plexippus]
MPNDLLERVMVENNVQSKQPFFMQNIMVDWGRFQGLENFQYPNFQVPNFQGANIQGPSFQGPNIQGPSFQDPNLQVPNSQGPGPDHNLQPNNFRYPQFNNAFGSYSGGYGALGQFNPNFPIQPQFFGPPRFPGPPRPPQPPPPIRDEQYSFQPRFCPDFPYVKKNPIDDKTMKSLLHCGLTKDTIRTLPRSLLKLYQSDNCGLCSQNLDTLGVARLHYISKNHQKKQKKWLTSRSDVGSHRIKEPLKARELYCELCDVHITSKIHSESHYSGKPHRAIVDGRKVPKNPFLIQRGMEERLDLLIRREKKFLKVEGEQESKKKEVKIIQPELYCEICETSVTCSEQMVMHLNGKRHLGKEKQHILKVMKGDNPETVKGTSNDVQGEKEDQSQQGEEDNDASENEQENWEDL